MTFSLTKPHAPRTKACNVCHKPFTPARPLQSVCSPRCAGKLGKLRKAAEKAETKARKEALETPKKLLPKAQKEVNRWVRFRDLLAGKGCISCGATYRTAFGGAFDAGHFRSVGSAGHLRFYTPQIRLQCVHCNRDLSGNVVEFRKGLVAERGAEWVEQVEGLYWVSKWTTDYLRRLIEVARKRANRLEKRYELRH